MNTSTFSERPGIFPEAFHYLLRWCSVATLAVSAGLLCISVFTYNCRTLFVASLFPSLLVALSFAVLLNVYSLWHLRREQRESDQAFRYTDCESASIFQNVLDGILILDSAGTCLDANSAAATILRFSSNELVGQNVGRFLVDSSAFEDWNALLQNKEHRGRARLVAGDETTLFVEFTTTINYLPGRHVLIICDVTERTLAELLLRQSEERFDQMANTIAEVFWRVDARTWEVTYVNSAYTTITGHSVESLQDNPSAYQELIHPEDRIRVLSRIQDLTGSGTLDEEFRFKRADGEVRWAWAKGVPVPVDGETRWIVGTAQDITSRKQAETRIGEQLEKVEAARAETEALRKSTLALSQNLAMDSVLDTLLRCISELVPFDRATVLFVQDGFELMVAREAPRLIPKRIGLTLKASENVFLQRVLFEKRAILLSDVGRETEWQDISPLDQLQSWQGIPLVAAGCVLGILSLGSATPCTFTTEHFRLAKSLAVPAAVAILNARTHQRAEIYAAELETRLGELREMQKRLEDVERKTFRAHEH